MLLKRSIFLIAAGLMGQTPGNTPSFTEALVQYYRANALFNAAVAEQAQLRLRLVDLQTIIRDQQSAVEASKKGLTAACSGKLEGMEKGNPVCK